MGTEFFKQKCKEHGLKMTPQRMVIYEAIVHSKEHPSADKVYKQISDKHPNISFDTVNRTLLKFAEIGLIRIAEEGSGRRFDPNTQTHHHLKCLQCQRIIDFNNDLYDKIQLPKTLPCDFVVVNKQVILEGFCPNCQSHLNKESSHGQTI